MGRSQETYSKKEVRNKKEKKRKEKEKKRLAKKEKEKKSSFDDMIAYVDENGMISSAPPDPNKKQETKLEDIEISPVKRDIDVDMDSERKGVVEYFDSSKGYGFIRDKETNESIFMHVNNTLDDITKGNNVTFKIEKGKKGLIAVGVKLI